MKKHFYLLLASSTLTYCSQAQFKKGDVLLGGDIGFTYQHSTDPQTVPSTNNSDYFTVRPSLAKAIKDNFFVGVDLAFAYTKQNVNNNGILTPSNNYTYGLGVFLRQYKPLGKGFSVFCQERLGGSYSKSSVEGTDAGKASSVQLSFYPGIAYGICKRVQLETGFLNLLSIDYQHSSGPGGYKSDSFSAGTSLSNALDNFVVGCRFLL